MMRFASLNGNIVIPIIYMCGVLGLLPESGLFMWRLRKAGKIENYRGNGGGVVISGT